MPKSNGVNYKNLTSVIKEQIVEKFCSGCNVPDLIKEFGTTKRAIPEVLSEYQINTKRKGRYTLNENYFNTIDTSEKAYWLGLIAADGCITESNYFAISLIDKDILIKLKESLNYSGEVYKPKIKNGNTVYRINFSSERICNDLRKHGIYENKSLTYNKLPNIRHGLMRHFVRGYFDGDGCISESISTSYHNDKVYEYRSFMANIIATDKFCTCLKDELYNEIGYNASIDKSKTDGMSYIKIFKNKALKDFYWYLYCNTDLYLKRKHDKWKIFMGSFAEKSASNN